MSVEKNFLALLYLGTRQRHAEHERRQNRNSILRSASHHLGSEIAKRSARKTKNLITVLLSHGIRAARSAQPRAKISMNVFLPNGRKAVRIKMAR